MNNKKCNICGKSMGNSNRECHIRCMIAYDLGFNVGLDCTSKSHLNKDNHKIGCELESYTNILRYRGYEKEADIIDEVASRIK